MRVGFVTKSLGNAQPVRPLTADYDMMCVALQDSSYRASTELVNRARRDTPLMEYSEEPGLHSPCRCKGQTAWAWEDDDNDDLWRDAVPLRECSVTYAKLLADDPRSARAWYGLGLAQRRLGEYVASLRALDMCIKLRSDGALDGEAPGAAWNARGRTLLRAERPLSALASFQRAVKADPDRLLYKSNVAILEHAIRARAEAAVERRGHKRACYLEVVSFLPAALESANPEHGEVVDDDETLTKSSKTTSVVSTARRLASESRMSRFQDELVAYDAEHEALLKTLPDYTKGVKPQIGFRKLGRELANGAEHLARSLKLELGDYELVAAQRSGQTRLRIYAKPHVKSNIVHVETAFTTAHDPGALPSSGAAAVAVRFRDQRSLCFAALDLTATGHAVETATDADLHQAPSPSAFSTARTSFFAPRRRTSCSHVVALRNRIACAALAALKLGDRHRSISEQFDHSFVVGSLGYGDPRELAAEIKAGRAFAGWTVHDGFLARSAPTEASRLRAAERWAEISPRIAWTPYAGEKKKMPKLVLKNLSVTSLPLDPPLRTYAMVTIEPRGLLAGSCGARTDLATLRDDKSACWSHEQLVLRLRLNGDEEPKTEGLVNVVLSVWAHDAFASSDALVGVARFSTDEENVVCPLTLHGRVMGVLHATVNVVTPDDPWYQRETSAMRRTKRPSFNENDEWPSITTVTKISAPFHTTWRDRHFDWEVAKHDEIFNV